MAKAKARNSKTELHKHLKEFQRQHEVRHDADYLLDEIVRDANRVLQSKPNHDAVLNAKIALTYAGHAREGSVTAGIRAERHRWRMVWFEQGITEAMVAADERLVLWRGRIVDCGRKKQLRRMLELIGDDDRVSLDAFMHDADFQSMGTMRKAFTTLHGLLADYRFKVSEPMNLIVVESVT